MFSLAARLEGRCRVCRAGTWAPRHHKSSSHLHLLPGCPRLSDPPRPAGSPQRCRQDSCLIPGSRVLAQAGPPPTPDPNCRHEGSCARRTLACAHPSAARKASTASPTERGARAAETLDPSWNFGGWCSSFVHLRLLGPCWSPGLWPVLPRATHWPHHLCQATAIHHEP